MSQSSAARYAKALFDVALQESDPVQIERDLAAFSELMSSNAELLGALTSPAVPVTAKLLERNEASRRTAEAAGLQLVWRGRDLGNADETAVRLVYADRELDAATLRAHTHSFMR